MDWLIENKEWVFSGIGVLIISLVIALITESRKKTQPQPPNQKNNSPNTSTITQTNYGRGDNVAGNKIVNR